MRSYPTYLSLLNYVATAAITTTDPNGSATADYIRSPGRPFLPWRTGALGAQNIVINFGSTKSVKLLLLVRTNFTTANIQGHPSDSWGAPAFDQAITISRNPWNYRYQWGMRVVGFSYQYMRISIPSQSTTDGSTGYLLGGVWAGDELRIPRQFRFDYDAETVEPLVDMIPPHQGWRQRLIMGEPMARFTFSRIATIDQFTPGYADQLLAWKDIDRQIRENDICALLLTTQDPAQAFVVRPTGDNKWRRNKYTMAEHQITYEEVLGP